MQLIQILLPIYDNAGQAFGPEKFDTVRSELMTCFGGLTAFVQAPALGLWRDGKNGTTERDDMILVEVMVEDLDRDWWAGYRRSLEALFRQDEIILRATACERL